MFSLDCRPDERAKGASSLNSSLLRDGAKAHYFNKVPDRMRYQWGAVALLLVMLVPLPGTVENASAENVEIWGPGAGELNLTGGRWGKFSTATCQISVGTVMGVGRIADGSTIEISVHQHWKRPCGLWMHLFNENVGPRSRGPSPASGYLRFWVKGGRGAEDFSIAMADAELAKRDDSHIAGSVRNYLADGVTSRWQPVNVPLKDFGLKHAPVSLAILFTSPGEWKIFIDTIGLTDAAGIGELGHGSLLKHANALWVWNTEELLHHAASRDELFAFARKNEVRDIFLQIFYSVGKNNRDEPSVSISNQTAFRVLLAEANTAEIRVHALDGDPEFSLKGNHGQVMALIRAIREFNRGSPPNQRFYGIHLDNEPYLLIGFDGPQRDLILRQFLELNDRVKKVLRESHDSLVYGVDIPFWFSSIQATPENSGASAGPGDSITDRILQVVDNVCIMDYRTQASGPDGIIEHARSAIQTANLLAKQVFIGVETFRESATPVHFVYGVTEDEWETLGRENAPLMRASRLDAFPLRVFDDGVRHHSGLLRPVEAQHGRSMTC